MASSGSSKGSYGHKYLYREWVRDSQTETSIADGRKVEEPLRKKIGRRSAEKAAQAAEDEDKRRDEQRAFDQMLANNEAADNGSSRGKDTKKN